MTVSEWDCETDVNLLNGQEIVRFRYRHTWGRGRWTRFVVVPDEAQTTAEIIANARDIVTRHAAGPVSVTPPDQAGGNAGK